MAIQTPNIGLIKDDESEFYNVGRVNNNLDIIDQQIGNKVEKVDGKGLSTEDYTTDEKAKLAGIAPNANNYVHPTTSGNKHIPSGGTVGQVLKNTASGTASWQDDSAYVHPVTHPAEMIQIADAGNYFTGARAEEVFQEVGATLEDIENSKVSVSDVATQAEAEAGIATSGYMTPQRTAQGIAALKDTVDVGDIIIAWDNRSTNNKLIERLSYTKAKEIKIGVGGNLRISFTLGSSWSTGSGGGSARIYKNGSPVGMTRIIGITSTVTLYTEDIGGWQSGDLVQVYFKNDTMAGFLNISNFYISCNKAQSGNVYESTLFAYNNTGLPPISSPLM